MMAMMIYSVYQPPGVAELVPDADRGAQVDDGPGGCGYIAVTDTDTNTNDY